MPVFLVQVEEICDGVQMLSQTPVPLPPCYCAQGLAKVYGASGVRGGTCQQLPLLLGPQGGDLTPTWRGYCP